MVFIPDDMLVESLRESVKSGDDADHRVLINYAMLCQNEGREPDAARVAESAGLTLGVVRDALDRLSKKGWLDAVRDYSE